MYDQLMHAAVLPCCRPRPLVQLLFTKASKTLSFAFRVCRYADNIDVTVAGGEAAKHNVAAIVSVLELRKDD